MEDLVRFHQGHASTPPLTNIARYRLFDVSKQVVGQMFIHGLNVVISDLGSQQFSGNACTYYFLNILVDTTLGKPQKLFDCDQC